MPKVKRKKDKMLKVNVNVVRTIHQSRLIEVDIPQEIFDEGGDSIENFIIDSDEVMDTDFTGAEDEAEYSVDYWEPSSQAIKYSDH